MEKEYTIGIDIGGTKARIAVVSKDAEIKFQEKFKTGFNSNPNSILDRIEKYSKKIKEKDKSIKIKGVGIGIAGQVNEESDTLIYAPNLNWRNEPFGKKVRDRLDLPVYMLNDVNAATVAEWKYGEGQGSSDIVCIFVGTGVGGGIISGGKLITGCNNSAGELGHMTIKVDGRQCRCGNRGCIEAYVGGWAIAERAKESVERNYVGCQNVLSIAGSFEDISARTIGIAYREKNPLAEKILKETGHYLASGMVGIVNALNPCYLIFGGGVIEGIPELIEIVKKELEPNLFGMNYSSLKIKKAYFREDAVVAGSSYMVLNEIG